MALIPPSNQFPYVDPFDPSNQYDPYSRQDRMYGRVSSDPMSDPYFRRMMDEYIYKLRCEEENRRKQQWMAQQQDSQRQQIEKDNLANKLIDSIATLEKSDAIRIDEPVIQRPSPDYVHTLTGWRGWQIKENQLGALGATGKWEPKKVIPAICTPVYGVTKKPHHTPASDCTCGYWSFKSLDLMKKAAKEYVCQISVIGTVEIWGMIIECENGFRSEFAYPKELWLLKPDLEYLSWAYGVPVRRLGK